MQSYNTEIYSTFKHCKLYKFINKLPVKIGLHSQGCQKVYNYNCKTGL
jgi:hypothetical protein